MFLAHLSTVLRVSYCDRPLSVVSRRPSCVVRQPFYFNISAETARWILTKLNRNGPWVVPLPKLFKWFLLVAYVGHGVKNRFSKGKLKNLLVWNYKAHMLPEGFPFHQFHIWYITSSRRPLLRLFKLCPRGQNWHRPGGHNFALNYIRTISSDFLSWAAIGNLAKLNRNGPWVVLYQNCSNGSDWLHKLVQKIKKK